MTEAAPALGLRQLWLSEHYLPGLAPELVLGQAQRLARAPDSHEVVALPGQQTVFGLWLGEDEDDVRRTLARAGMGSGPLSAGWLLTRQPVALETSSLETATAVQAADPAS